MIQFDTGMNLQKTFLLVSLLAYLCLVQAGVVHSQIQPPPPISKPMTMTPPIIPQIPKPSSSMPQPSVPETNLKPQLSLPTPAPDPARRQ
jgi:hypothetical protein